MEFTAKQVARLLIDNAKGKVVLPANFSEQGMVTPEEAISNAFFTIMGLEKGKATVQDIQLAFRKESVRLGVFAIVEEVIREGILAESWRNPFLDQFVESRSQTRGDQTYFFIEAKNELHVSQISKDGKVSLDRQRFDQGHEITVDLKTYGIKVYEHLARIMLGRADWGSLVAHLNAAVEKFIQLEVYKAFAGVTALAPAQCKLTGITGAESEKGQILAAVREVFANRQTYIDAMSQSGQMDSIGTILDLIEKERKHKYRKGGSTP